MNTQIQAIAAANVLISGTG